MDLLKSAEYLQKLDLPQSFVVHLHLAANQVHLFLIQSLSRELHDACELLEEIYPDLFTLEGE